MAFLQLDKLEKLEELRHLDSLKQTQHLDQLQNLNRLDELKPLEHLDKLQELHRLDQLQSLEPLNRLQELSQLHQMEVLKNLQHLERLHDLDRLQQLQMLKRLDNLEGLNRLQDLQVLKNLTQLGNLQQLEHMNRLEALPVLNKLQYIENLRSLDKLQQLGVLDHLKVLNRIDALNYHSLLFLGSFFIPGLIFQEAVSIFSREHLDLKRSLVLMVAYNLLNLLVAILWIYPHLTEPFASRSPAGYYLIWLGFVLLIPFVLGASMAMVANTAPFGKFIKALVTSVPTGAVASAWDRFLTEAESYQVIITLNNEHKIMGVFQRGMHTPQTQDPDGLYFTETSHRLPQSNDWEDLAQPAGIWVKSSEIKTVEVTPQTP